MPLAEDLDIVRNKISGLKDELDILNNKINVTKDNIQYKSIPSTNITNTDENEVQTDLETHLKNIDTKFVAIPSLPIYGKDVNILPNDWPNNTNLLEHLTDISLIMPNITHNTNQLKTAVHTLGITITDWKS
jgi:hypothetical protein